MTNQTLLKLCVWLSQQNGEPLDVLHQELLSQALEGVRLMDIEIDGFSPHYVQRVVAPNLWQQLGRYCGQRVGIRRLHVVLTQKYNRLSLAERTAVEKIEIQREMLREDVPEEKKNLVKARRRYSGIPASDYAFYNQERTIQQLQTHLQQNRYSLIFVFGSGGIGKTALVSQLLRQDRELEACTLWCNLSDRLDFQHNLEFIREQWELTQSISGDRPETDISEIKHLCEHLQQHQKILVFDHWERLFASEHLSGNYQPSYEIYRLLLEQLAQQSLRGTVIVISREIGTTMEQLSQTSPVVTTLTVPELSPVHAKKILQEYQLKDKELWANFITPYRGNPLNLRLICTAIREWFGGSIAQFQQQNTLIGGDTLKDILQELIQHINPFEREILYWLMLWAEPITLEQLQQKYQREIPFASQLWDAVRSLERRFLLEKLSQENPPLLTLQPSVQRYLAKKFTTICCEEITQAIANNYDVESLQLLNHYHLSPHAPTEGMSPVLLPMLRGLINTLRSETQIAFHLAQLQQVAEANSPEHRLISENLHILQHHLAQLSGKYPLQ